eukprot:RCo019443
MARKTMRVAVGVAVVVLGAYLLVGDLLVAPSPPPPLPTCATVLSCGEGKKLTPLAPSVGCRAQPCTLEECCVEEVHRVNLSVSLPSGNCSSVAIDGCWPRLLAPNPERRRCAGPTCALEECCVEAPMCSSMKNSLRCPPGMVPQLNPERWACSGLICTAEDCCVQAPTCAESVECPTFMDATENVTGHCAAALCTLEECCSLSEACMEPFGWHFGPIRMPWAARSQHCMVVFQGHLYLAGGWTRTNVLLNDVWRSPDGLQWTQPPAAPSFGARRSHSCVVFQEQLMVLGGYPFNGEVWGSRDGSKWDLFSPTSGSFTPRSNHGTAVFLGKLWVIAGWQDDGPTLNDVWSSNRGMWGSWERVQTGEPMFGPRSSHGVVVFRERLWVVSGCYLKGFTYRDDVWSSADGKTWVMETRKLPFPGRSDSLLVEFQGQLVLMGGRNYYGPLDEAWRSRTSGKWTRMPPVPGPITEFAGAVLGKKLFLSGGVYMGPPGTNAGASSVVYTLARRCPACSSLDCPSGTIAKNLSRVCANEFCTTEECCAAPPSCAGFKCLGGLVL